MDSQKKEMTQPLIEANFMWLHKYVDRHKRVTNMFNLVGISFWHFVANEFLIAWEIAFQLTAGTPESI